MSSTASAFSWTTRRTSPTRRRSAPGCKTRTSRGWRCTSTTCRRSRRSTATGSTRCASTASRSALGARKGATSPPTSRSRTTRSRRGASTSTSPTPRTRSRGRARTGQVSSCARFGSCSRRSRPRSSRSARRRRRGSCRSTSLRGGAAASTSSRRPTTTSTRATGPTSLLRTHSARGGRSTPSIPSSACTTITRQRGTCRCSRGWAHAASPCSSPTRCRPPTTAHSRASPRRRSPRLLWSSSQAMP